MATTRQKLIDAVAISILTAAMTHQGNLTASMYMLSLPLRGEPLGS